LYIVDGKLGHPLRCKKDKEAAVETGAPERRMYAEKHMHIYRNKRRLGMHMLFQDGIVSRKYQLWLTLPVMHNPGTHA